MTMAKDSVRVAAALLVMSTFGCSAAGPSASESGPSPSGSAAGQDEVAAAPSNGPTPASEDGTPKAPTFHSLRVSWQVKQPDGAATGCPANYPKVAIVASAVGSGSMTDVQNGDDRITLADCGAKAVTLKLQTSGDEPEEYNADQSLKRRNAVNLTGKYAVTMFVTEGSGQIVWQSTWTEDVDLTSGDKSLAFDITPEASSRRTLWRFYGKSNGQTALPSCAAAGVEKVRIKSKRVQLADQSPDPAPLETVETFPCENDPDDVSCLNCLGSGTSKPLRFGYYATSIEALAPSGQVVGSLPYDEGTLVRVDKDSIAFGVSGGGNASRARIGLFARQDFTVTIDHR